MKAPRSTQQVTIWLTGISASGKTTLAGRLEAGLKEHGFNDVLLVDGETLRRQLGRSYGHSVADRFEVLRQIVAHVESQSMPGRVIIVATISHKRRMRVIARERLQPFMEVHVFCPAALCAKRDTKGHYVRAYNGEYECFVGVTEPYEESKLPELLVDTGTHNIEQASALLIQESLVFLKAAD